MKDEPAVTKFQRIFDRLSLLVKSMFTSFWPRPITYCTKYTQQFLKSMTHTICFLTYYIWRGDILPHLDRLGTFVSSSIDGRFFRRHIQASMSITRWCHVTWCFTVLTVKYVSDWRNCHFFDSPAVLAKLLQWMWRTKTNLVVGMTSWLADLNEENICRAVLWWHLSWYVTTSASIRSPEAIESCGSGFPY